ncbi:MAG: type II secretion system F family protein [Pirellulaceae bacterium]|nr:type II secretion system F family protein [Pirellulaceae bacterium]
MMTLKQRALFCRRLSIGLSAGVDLLRVLENEQKSATAQHRHAIGQVIAQIRGGNSLAEALRAQPGYFPWLLTQLVDASELGGRTESILAYLADYYDQLQAAHSTFRQRVSGPLIQLVLAIGVVGLVIVLQGVLSPNSGYDASGLGLRGFSGLAIFLAVLGVAGGIASLVFYGLWKNFFQCHRWVVPVLYRVPQVGTALQTLGLARLSVTLSMLLNAGVDAKRSVKQAFQATGNHYLMSGTNRALVELSRGASFADAFEKSAVLPDDFVDAVRIGEISGTETESLDRLASQYQQQATAALVTVANLASVAVWIAIAGLIVWMIFRMALQYVNLLNNAVTM